jgi:hypothetical protein
MIFLVGFVCVGGYFGYNYYSQSQTQLNEDRTPRKGDFSNPSAPNSARSDM